MPNNIEVEVRSFVSARKYRDLLKLLKKEAKFLGQEKQLTYYLSGPADLRIQKSGDSAKVWLKKGKLHQNAREELEIKVPGRDFDKLKALFLALGYKIEIGWQRTRNNFQYKGFTLAVDFTKGYGYILEVEKMTAPKKKTETLKKIYQIFEKLGVSRSLKEEFEKKFARYKKNWRRYAAIKE